MIYPVLRFLFRRLPIPITAITLTAAYFALLAVRRSLSRSLTLRRNVAVVIGADNTIGRALAIALAVQKRMLVALWGSNEQALLETKRTIFSRGGECSAFKVDLRRPREVRSAATRVTKLWKASPTLLVNSLVGPGKEEGRMYRDLLCDDSSRMAGEEEKMGRDVRKEWNNFADMLGQLWVFRSFLPNHGSKNYSEYEGEIEVGRGEKLIGATVNGKDRERETETWGSEGDGVEDSLRSKEEMAIRVVTPPRMKNKEDDQEIKLVTMVAAEHPYGFAAIGAHESLRQSLDRTALTTTTKRSAETLLVCLFGALSEQYTEEIIQRTITAIECRESFLLFPFPLPGPLPLPLSLSLPWSMSLSALLSTAVADLVRRAMTVPKTVLALPSLLLRSMKFKGEEDGVNRKRNGTGQNETFVLVKSNK